MQSRPETAGTAFITTGGILVDIRAYFEKLHRTEQSLTGHEIVVVSEATPDGGKPGIISEIHRQAAAKLITEGRARLASDEEVASFREATERAIAKAEHARLAQKVQVTVLSDHDFRQLKSARTTKN
jgi:hypothetical protein